MHILHPIIVRSAVYRLSLFLMTMKLPFFETTWIGNTHSLPEMGHKILAASIFSTSLRTTSLRLGLKLFCHFVDGFALSSISMRCMHRAGSRPFISLMVQLIALWWFLRKARKKLLLSIDGLSLIIIGWDLSSLRNLYVNPSSGCFSSKTGVEVVVVVMTTVILWGIPKRQVLHWCDGEE